MFVPIVFFVLLSSAGPTEALVGLQSGWRKVLPNPHHPHHPVLKPRPLAATPETANVDEKNTNQSTQNDRFHRTASHDAKVEEPILFQIDKVTYNLTAWAKAHPGGHNILKKYHEKDATKAFHAVRHSKEAYEMLQQFAVLDNGDGSSSSMPLNATTTSMSIPESTTSASISAKPRWRQKLFSGEDPFNVHKVLGVGCLLNFIFRYGQIYFGDPSAGLGSRLGKGPAPWSALCLVPHTLLSLSSLLFHTVPRERVVGKPMIWQEFRVHNIIFALRSILVAALGWLAYYRVGHVGRGYKALVVANSLVCLSTHLLIDETTRRLSDDNQESLVATHPFWEGCSDKTQRRFKNFYAVSQIQATLVCMWFGNPAWALAVLPPYQILSLLMTLVRKGLCSTKWLHIVYTASLVMPYFMALHDIRTALSIVGIGTTLFQLRRRGVSKYALWIPVLLWRITAGDQFMCYQKF